MMPDFRNSSVQLVWQQKSLTDIHVNCQLTVLTQPRLQFLSSLLV